MAGERASCLMKGSLPSRVKNGDRLQVTATKRDSHIRPRPHSGGRWPVRFLNKNTLFLPGHGQDLHGANPPTIGSPHRDPRAVQRLRRPYQGRSGCEHIVDEQDWPFDSRPLPTKGIPWQSPPLEGIPADLGREGTAPLKSIHNGPSPLGRHALGHPLRLVVRTAGIPSQGHRNQNHGAFLSIEPGQRFSHFKSQPAVSRILCKVDQLSCFSLMPGPGPDKGKVGGDSAGEASAAAIKTAGRHWKQQPVQAGRAADASKPSADGTG